MKSLDLESIVVAGLIGAALLWALNAYFTSSSTTTTPSGTMMGSVGTGFAVGAGVQIGVRLLGVS